MARQFRPNWNTPCLNCGQEFGRIKSSKLPCSATKHKFTQSNHLSTDPAKLAEIRAMVEDGCSNREIERTTGVSSKAVKRNFPDSGWTAAESGRFGMLVRWAG